MTPKPTDTHPSHDAPDTQPEAGEEIKWHVWIENGKVTGHRYDPANCDRVEAWEWIISGNGEP